MVKHKLLLGFFHSGGVIKIKGLRYFRISARGKIIAYKQAFVKSLAKLPGLAAKPFFRNKKGLS